MPNKKKKGFYRSKPATDQSDIRPKQRMQWSNEQVELAMKAVFDGGVSANKAAILHGVPRPRVLTSYECLKAFQEKEDKKWLAEEEKQRKKTERELKQKQKEEELNRKKEF